HVTFARSGNRVVVDHLQVGKSAMPAQYQCFHRGPAHGRSPCCDVLTIAAGTFHCNLMEPAGLAPYSNQKSCHRWATLHCCHALANVAHCVAPYLLSSSGLTGL